MENFDAFNWDNITTAVGEDPFAEATRKYEEDTRFYRLPKNEKGAGVAVIRFLPDAENQTIKRIYKIGTTIVKNGKKRFLNEVSPLSYGGKCPFQEEWARLYNLGEKEESKNFGRNTRYIANIKVIKDPAKPENEGKIFLLDMSQSLAAKVQAALAPSEEDIMTGEVAKQLFNPLKGNSFKYACVIGSNNITDYSPSKPMDAVDGIYTTVEEALKDIKENTYSLNDFVKPENNLSYDELVEKLKWVTWQDADSQATQTQEVKIDPKVEAEIQKVETGLETLTTPEIKVETPEVKPEAKKNEAPDLDAMLASLV